MNKVQYCKSCSFELPEKLIKWADYCNECFDKGHPFKKVKYV